MREDTQVERPIELLRQRRYRNSAAVAFDELRHGFEMLSADGILVIIWSKAAQRTEYCFGGLGQAFTELAEAAEFGPDQ